MANKMTNILETNGLNKQYQMGEVEINALRGVDFSVRQGEFVAVMGPSGSGKSTLLHLMGGLDTPSDGEISLAGMRLTRLSDDEITVIRRRQVGFIFQFFNLLPTLTAAENLALPLLIDGKRQADYQARIEEMLRLVGLSDRKDHKPDQLSGGQQQRVAIARALVTQPAIVLADEPTGNLDSKSGSEILQLLRRTCDQQGQTIVMVTHDPRAAAYADRVVFLRDGQVVRELKPAPNTQAIMDVMAELEL
ncbi:MAG: Lipoprotein-releasing system ATP-binding protein LolD [Anaerolineae bacterium]|nr:Lipoprotein-releasing system ATP-binding protein LolD [Anaerolineae bacterium]